MDDVAPSTFDDRCPECGHEVATAWLVCAWCGQRLAAPAELPVGARLSDGRYEVVRVIGRGGFGITYEAFDHRLERPVAIKELFPDSAVRHGSVVLTPPDGRAAFHQARERFLREARVLARFTHPGIVRVYEVFEEHGTAYLVMELLVGRSLVALLHQRGRPFAEDEVLDVAARVAAALRPVHVAGVLHRDINPANVMLTDDGRIVVIDFGLARDYNSAQTVGMTRMVTPGYAPIEQYRGQARFGPPTDIYGLAAMLYRLATGRVPASALDRSGGAELVAPHRLNPAISKRVSDAIRDGLEIEPGHRPQDLDSLLARLGIRRLPDTPRSLLVESLPPATQATPAGPADAGPGDASPADDAPAPVAGGPPSPSPVAPVVPVAPVADRVPVPLARVGGPDTDPTFVPGPLALVERPEPSEDRTALPVMATTGGTVAAPMAPPPAAPRPDLGPPLPASPTAHPPGRRKVLWPLVAVALAWGSVAPVLATFVLVVLALPLLATLGDSEAHRLRALHGLANGRLETRLSPGAMAPGRFLANLGRSALRAVIVVGSGAILLGGWYALRSAHVPAGVLDAVLRVGGLAVTGTLLAATRLGSGRFRIGLGIDAITAQFVPEGRTTERVLVAWVVAVALVAAALWLDPAPFPLT